MSFAEVKLDCFKVVSFDWFKYREVIVFLYAFNNCFDMIEIIMLVSYIR